MLAAEISNHSKNIKTSLTKIHDPSALKTLKSKNLVNGSGDDIHNAESIADIFIKRLRTLKKRLVKIEKNEEILAQKSLDSSKLKKGPQINNSNNSKGGNQNNSIESSQSLNPDQLKAIEAKATLLEVIKEVEHLNDQVVEWQKMQEEPLKSKKNDNKIKANLEEKLQLPSSSHSALVDEAHRNVFSLWIALNRLDAVSTSLLSPEDFQGLRTLYWILHSLTLAKNYHSGLTDIISWMNGAVMETSSICSLLPSYDIVKYCIGKILLAPMDESKLPSDLSCTVKLLERLTSTNNLGKTKLPKEKLELPVDYKEPKSSNPATFLPAEIPRIPAPLGIIETSADTPMNSFKENNYSSNNQNSSSPNYSSIPTGIGSYSGFLPSAGVFSLGGSGHINSSVSTSYGNNSVGLTSAGHLTFSPINGSSLKSPPMANNQYEVGSGSSNASVLPANQSQSSKVIGPYINPSTKPTSIPETWTYPTDSAILRAGRVTSNEILASGNVGHHQRIVSKDNITFNSTSSSTTKPESDTNGQFFQKKANNESISLDSLKISSSNDPVKKLVIDPIDIQKSKNPEKIGILFPRRGNGNYKFSPSSVSQTSSSYTSSSNEKVLNERVPDNNFKRRSFFPTYQEGGNNFRRQNFGRSNGPQTPPKV